jgi:hypothetical protein
VTIPEFERAALAIIKEIPDSTAHVAKVTDTLASVRCRIGYGTYELSFSFVDEHEREQAFGHILRGAEDTRRRFANG